MKKKKRPYYVMYQMCQPVSFGFDPIKGYDIHFVSGCVLIHMDWLDAFVADPKGVETLHTIAKWKIRLK